MNAWVLGVCLRRGIVWCEEAGGYTTWRQVYGCDMGYSGGACGPGQTMIIYNPVAPGLSTEGKVTRTRIAI